MGSNENPLQIRPLTEADAAAVLELVGEVLEHCQTTLSSAGEFNCTVAQEQAYLRRFAAPPRLALGAFDGEALLGVIFLNQMEQRRTCHRGEVGLSVRPAEWGRGIATALLGALLGRTRAMGALRRIEASVLSNNPASERLFLRAGFQIEGVRREAARVGEEFVDEKLLGLLL